jgi:WD40 repeat protein
MVILKFIKQRLLFRFCFVGFIFRIEFRLKPHDEERNPPIQTIHDRADRIQSLAFSPNDKYLAVGCVDGSLDIYDGKNQFKNLHFKNMSKYFDTFTCSLQ